MNSTLKILCWNVRGLNEREKRAAVKQTPKLEKPEVICFQETKLNQASLPLVYQACGKKYDQFLAVDALQTKGGLITAWNSDILSIENSMAATFHLTVDFIIRKDGSKFRLTNVYGPSNQIGRDSFFREIRSMCPLNNTPWMICGDFNLTLQPGERTNPLNNQLGTAEFADLVDDLQLFDLQMEGRSYTWSNLRFNPSMARLDRFLCNQSFTDSYPNIHQKALANTSSDHCPLLCSFGVRFQPTNIFRVENFFLKIPEFTDLVLNFWLSEEVASTPEEFNSKLSNLTRIISRWKKGRLSSLDRQLGNIRDFLAWTDRISEIRPLSELEALVRALLKRRFTVLSHWEETRWRQRSAATWRLKGDRNSAYFHAVASAGKRKQFIESISVDGVSVCDHNNKARAFHSFICSLMGAPSTDSGLLESLEWSMLYPTSCTFPTDLTQPISDREIRQAIAD